MRLTLIHPPLDDPTIPYHANAHLLGHLIANGFSDVKIRDINIEFINYCLEEAVVDSFYAAGERRLVHLRSKAELKALEQAELLELWKGKRIESNELQAAAKGLRTRETFLDYSSYIRHVKILQRYFKFLGALSFPCSISNCIPQSTDYYSLYNMHDLFDQGLANKICQPLLPFFEDRLRFDPGIANSDCFGISIVYNHQIVHALWLARSIKKLWPHKPLVLGGTSISQLYKYLKDKGQMRMFFDFCDAIVVGEGETAICELLDKWANGDKPSELVNTITYDRVADKLSFPTRIHYENVQALGTPVYDYVWDLYLSPERGINYAPTRGCYWNRCTFCDYGLNTDRPTSPWRERSISQVIADLCSITEDEKIKYVYFAVDVMAPGYLERLSNAIVNSKLRFTWASELRMEKIFSSDRCKKLADAGCVCISFGMESGDQRILDLIDKGTKISDMQETMKNFSSSGIAVQLMAFSGFPTETAVERNATVEFVNKNKEFWSAGGMGQFVLTGTAMVAKNPHLYNITVMQRQDLDIARALTYCEGPSKTPKVISAEAADASFNDVGSIFPLVLGRPWAGGTDTLHSMIYYGTYGKNVFKDNSKLVAHDVVSSEINPTTARRVILNGKLCKTPIDIRRLMLTSVQLREYVKKLSIDSIEPTYGRVLDWQAQVGTVPIMSPTVSYWITNEETSGKLHPLIWDLLSRGAGSNITVADMLSPYRAEVRERIIDHFRMLHSKSMISFADM